ncbi:MAG: hypothetical protein JJT85_06090 [Chromatiales bacterium]|nr:hypothetical protein [Chromatiales bacterium]
MDMEDDLGFESMDDTHGESQPGQTAFRLAAWRRIEEERELRQLKKALEDFDDYIV